MTQGGKYDYQDKRSRQAKMVGTGLYWQITPINNRRWWSGMEASTCEARMPSKRVLIATSQSRELDLTQARKQQ
jgi:hypothetical protein